jgi:hypothetical protein
VSKKDKVQRKPNLSPQAMLRPRLDGLFGNAVWTERSQQQSFADLDVVTRGIKPEDYLPVLLAAVDSLDGPSRGQIERVVQDWLTARDAINALAQLVERGELSAGTTNVAQQWLRLSGRSAQMAIEVRDPGFCDAYFGQDNFGSQGELIILWYANRSRTRVKGLAFLLDYNPPWEGAVKDVAVLPQRSVSDALAEFVKPLHESIPRLRSVDAIEAKSLLIEHLENNRSEQIRLHSDLIAVRDEVVKHLLSLPDGPDTPEFDAADFDALCQIQGKTPEAIMHFERTVARRVRMEDGKEVFVDAALANESWDD